MFTKLHVGVDEYHDNTKFGAKMKNILNHSTWTFWQTDCKIKQFSWMNEQRTSSKAAKVMSHGALVRPNEANYVVVLLS